MSDVKSTLYCEHCGPSKGFSFARFDLSSTLDLEVCRVCYDTLIGQLIHDLIEPFRKLSRGMK